MNQTIIRPLAPGDEEYLRDESKRTGHADAIAFPETEDQIREILQEASRIGMPVTIQGSRTGLAAAGTGLTEARYNFIFIMATGTFVLYTHLFRDGCFNHFIQSNKV